MDVDVDDHPKAFRKRIKGLRAESDRLWRKTGVLNQSYFFRPSDRGIIRTSIYRILVFYFRPHPNPTAISDHMQASISRQRSRHTLTHTHTSQQFLPLGEFS